MKNFVVLLRIIVTKQYFSEKFGSEANRLRKFFKNELISV